MSVRTTTAYSLFCDGCGGRFDGNDWTIWEHQDDMVEMAIDSDWSSDGVLYHCPACPMVTECECCGQPAGDDPMGIRDDYCVPCYDSSEANKPTGECTLVHVKTGININL